MAAKKKYPTQQYTLTICWDTSDSITVSKKCETRKRASTWASLCLAICGKNQYGSKYSRYFLFDKDDNVIESL